LDCLRYIRDLTGEYLLINQHQPPAFRFSSAQLDFMISTFTKRRELMATFFPWDDPNFGIDEQWARFDPYTAEVAAGGRVNLAVIIQNHSLERQQFRVTPHTPEGWGVPARSLRISAPGRGK